MQFNPITELSSAVYTATLRDIITGDVVSGSTLDSLTLTLFDEGTGLIINFRTNQNVLNANQVTVTSAGVLTWLLLPADNAIMGSTGGDELHTAEFYAVWNSGTRALSKRITFPVTNFVKLA